MKNTYLLLLSLLIAAIALLNVTAVAQAEGNPPQNPELQWQPSENESSTLEPAVGVEIYHYNWSNLNVATPSQVPPGTVSSIINASLVNQQGYLVSTLYGNEPCYLIVSFNGPGYFYLYEYYPSGKDPYGHWLCYRWYRPGAGVWKIGPFAAQPRDPEGPYTWKMWFLSDGSYWSTRSMSFNYLRQSDLSRVPFVSAPNPVYVQQSAIRPVINSFSADVTALEKGQSTVLRWTIADAVNAKIEPGVGTVANSGSTMVTPAATILYTLTATGASGNTVTSNITITVNARVQPVLTADVSKIDAGKVVTLSWNASGAASVSLAGKSGLASRGTMQVYPESTTTYTLVAQYYDGTSLQDSTTVEVQQAPYLLIAMIALLAAASMIIVLLLIRKYPVPQKVQPAAVPIMQSRPDTKPTEAVPTTSALTMASPAGLVMPDGSEMLLAGNVRSFGRRDFEKYLQKDTAAYISRQHVNVWQADGQYFIEDRSSTNGTRVNGAEIKGTGRHTLEDGDEIEIASKLNIKFKKINS